MSEWNNNQFSDYCFSFLRQNAKHISIFSLAFITVYFSCVLIILISVGCELLVVTSEDFSLENR